MCLDACLKAPLCRGDSMLQGHIHEGVPDLKLKPPSLPRCTCFRKLPGLAKASSILSLRSSSHTAKLHGQCNQSLCISLADTRLFFFEFGVEGHSALGSVQNSVLLLLASYCTHKFSSLASSALYALACLIMSTCGHRGSAHSKSDQC